MAITLQTYQTGVQRLLDDANANYWTLLEITDYINEARNQVATDTACVRQIFGDPSATPVLLTTNKDKYLFTDLIPNKNTVDIINVRVNFGNSWLPLYWRAFTVFSAYFRVWSQYSQQPYVFTTYGANILWLAPIPNQPYAVELDAAVLPDLLSAPTDVEAQLPTPYHEAVKFKAAWLAKLRFQAYNEAQKLLDIYTLKIQTLNAMYPRRIPDVYATEDQ